MKQLLFLLGVCFILTSCVEDTLYELTIDFTDGTRSTWECRSLGMVITTDLTNRHWGWTKTPVLEGLYSTHKNNKDVVVLCFHEPYWDENAMDLVEVLP